MKKIPSLAILFSVLFSADALADSHGNIFTRKLEKAIEKTIEKINDEIEEKVTGKKEPNTSTGNEQQLSRSDKQAIQQSLKSLGYDAGTPDGLFGPRTRAAISQYQTDNGRRATGYLTAVESDQLISLRAKTAGTGSDELFSSDDQPLYKRLMQAWLQVHREDVPQEVLGAVWGYAIEAPDNKDPYCKKIADLASHRGNSIDVATELDSLSERYRQWESQVSPVALPMDIPIDFVVERPYDDYDITVDKLRLRSTFSHTTDLADGRSGRTFSPCRSLLTFPGRLDISSTIPVPEKFVFNLNAILHATSVQSSGDDESSLQLSFVDLDRSTARQLLTQPEPALRVQAVVRMSKSPNPNQLSGAFQDQGGFEFELISMKSMDVASGVQIHDIELERNDGDLTQTQYEPRLLGTGLPPELASLDGAVVLYPLYGARHIETTPREQFALRQLQQKLLLQSNPELATVPEFALVFADLAGDNGDRFFVKKSLLELDEIKDKFRWESQASGDTETKLVVGWRSSGDVFEQRRMRDEYLNTVANNLLTEKIELPLDVVHLSPVLMRGYSFESNGFPLEGVVGLAEFQLSNLNIRFEGDPKLSYFNFREHVKPLLPGDIGAKVWKVPVDEAEKIQSSLKFELQGAFANLSEADRNRLERKNPKALERAQADSRARGVLARRMRITRLSYEPSRYEKIGQLVMDMELVSIVILDPRNYSNVIGVIKASSDDSSTVEKNSISDADTPKRLTPDIVRLLYAGHTSAQPLSFEFWQTAAEQRRQFDKVLVNNSWSSLKSQKPHWDAHFPRSVLQSRAPLSEEDIASYRQWSEQRVPFVGRNFLIGGVSARQVGQDLVTEGLGERTINRMIGLLRENGMRSRSSDKIETSMRQLAENEAKTKYPGSSAWGGFFIGEDLVTGIALMADPGWFESSWTIASDQHDLLSRLSEQEGVLPQLMVTVEDVHIFQSEQNKPGLILGVRPSKLIAHTKDGEAISYYPAESKKSDSLSLSRELDILGVSLGDSIDDALTVVEKNLEMKVETSPLKSKDPGLRDGYQIKAAGTLDQRDTSSVDVYYEPETKEVIAVGRQLRYRNAGVAPEHIVNSLVEKYGTADASYESKDSYYLGWGLSSATAAKIKAAYRLRDDCILYPPRNYKKDGLINTGELRVGCGSYLLAYIQKHKSTFLLLNSEHVLMRNIADEKMQKEVEQQSKQQKAENIKF